jgi:hypothetical protein
MSRRKIEVLFFEGCPNVDLALRRARAAVAAAGVEAEVLATVIDSQDVARRGFLGSPTVLVDGRDVADEAAPEESPSGFRCRIYPAADGRIEGAPPVEWIAAALRGERLTGARVQAPACCGTKSTPPADPA